MEEPKIQHGRPWLMDGGRRFQTCPKPPGRLPSKLKGFCLKRVDALKRKALFCECMDEKSDRLSRIYLRMIQLCSVVVNAMR